MNHGIGSRFKCDWPGCNKTFTRSDIKRKHEATHLKRQKRETLRDSTPVSPLSSSGLQVPLSIHNLKDHVERTSHVIPGCCDLESHISPTVDFSDNDIKSSEENIKVVIPSSKADPHAPHGFQQPSLSELIRCLTQGSRSISSDGSELFNKTGYGAFHSNDNGGIGSSTVSMLKEIFTIPPEFPNSINQNTVDQAMMDIMIKYIPSLKDEPDFEESKLVHFLAMYWAFYHPQYPILHRPSFSAQQAHPLLLLSMIMIGSSYSKNSGCGKGIIFVRPGELADKIAEPLRWLILSCEEARPACKPCVVQSLLILETYEMTRSSRYMHERAYVHHASSIQLLRRSPILGGDPQKSTRADLSKSGNLWLDWIERESMKRVALMSFYIDTMNAAVLGHPMNLFAHEIKLSLPCPDDFWEYENVDKDKVPNSLPIFSDSLQRLLRKQPVETGYFGQKILLGGLVNLLLQTTKRFSFPGWNYAGESWQNTLLSSLEFWRLSLPNSTCCFSFNVDSRPTSLPAQITAYQLEDRRCKFPEYHAAQLVLRIAHFEYYVYSGAPIRLNVPISPDDYEIVVGRIQIWAHSPSGPICAVLSYIFLCEILLSPESSAMHTTYIYEPDDDIMTYRPVVVINTVLTLWSYCFCLYGPESSCNLVLHDPESDYVPILEDAGSYLRRIRSEFNTLTGISFESLSGLSADEYGTAIKKYAQVLPDIPHQNNIIGLLSCMKMSFKKYRWEPGHEYAKLFGHCIERSLGGKEIFCTNMFDK